MLLIKDESTITKPTRITHNSATLIDNIYVNYTANNPHIQSAIIIHDISDHLPVISSLSYPNKRTHCKEPLTFEHRKITQSSLDKISNDLNKVNWNNLLNIPIHEAYNVFSTTLQDTINKYAPLKSIKNIT